MFWFDCFASVVGLVAVVFFLFRFVIFRHRARIKKSEIRHLVCETRPGNLSARVRLLLLVSVSVYACVCVCLRVFFCATTEAKRIGNILALLCHESCFYLNVCVCVHVCACVCMPTRELRNPDIMESRTSQARTKLGEVLPCLYENPYEILSFLNIIF